MVAYLLVEDRFVAVIGDSLFTTHCSLEIVGIQVDQVNAVAPSFQPVDRRPSGSVREAVACGMRDHDEHSHSGEPTKAGVARKR